MKAVYPISNTAWWGRQGKNKSLPCCFKIVGAHRGLMRAFEMRIVFVSRDGRIAHNPSHQIPRLPVRPGGRWNRGDDGRFCMYRKESMSSPSRDTEYNATRVPWTPRLPSRVSLELDPVWTQLTRPLGLGACKSLRNLVGPPRFELGTSCTPSKKYQSLTRALNENKRLRGGRFGRQMDAKTPNRAVWTPRGLHNLAARARGRHQPCGSLEETTPDVLPIRTMPRIVPMIFVWTQIT